MEKGKMLDPMDLWLKKVRDEPRVQDLIEEILSGPPSFLLLAGRPGIGKTNMALQIGFSLATGTPFLGFRTAKVRVAYLGFEGSKEKLADRIEKMSLNFPRPIPLFHLDIIPPFKFKGDNIIQIEEAARGCQVMIIDPLKYLVPGNYIQPSDALAFLTDVRNYMKRNTASFIFCHHIRKPNLNSLLEPGDLFESKGATDYAEAATSVLLLEREKQKHNPTGGFAKVDPDNTILYFSKTRDALGALDPLSLHFDRQRLLWMKRQY